MTVHIFFTIKSVEMIRDVYFFVRGTGLVGRRPEATIFNDCDLQRSDIKNSK